MNSRHEEISSAAYALWWQHGCPDDTANVDWLAAEQQLKAVELDRVTVDSGNDADIAQDAAAGNAVDPIEVTDLSRAK